MEPRSEQTRSKRTKAQKKVIEYGYDRDEEGESERKEDLVAPEDVTDEALPDGDVGDDVGARLALAVARFRIAAQLHQETGDGQRQALRPRTALSLQLLLDLHGKPKRNPHGSTKS